MFLGSKAGNILDTMLTMYRKSTDGRISVLFLPFESVFNKPIAAQWTSPDKNVILIRLTLAKVCNRSMKQFLSFCKHRRSHQSYGVVDGRGKNLMSVGAPMVVL